MTFTERSTTMLELADEMSRVLARIVGRVEDSGDWRLSEDELFAINKASQHLQDIYATRAPATQEAPAPPQCARDLLTTVTISASGLDITITCDDHETKDAIYDLLESGAALSGKPGAEQVRLQARRKGGEWIDIYPAQVEGMSATGHELRAISGNAEVFLPTLDEYRNNLVEQCAKVAEGTGAAMFSDSEVAAIDALRADISSGIRALAITRPESGGAT